MVSRSIPMPQPPTYEHYKPKKGVRRGSTSWRKAIFQCKAEILVNDLSFFIALFLLTGLLFKSEPLVKRVIQFRVGIAELFVCNKSLETLA